MKQNNKGWSKNAPTFIAKRIETFIIKNDCFG